jgi:hypothetical protein
MWANTLLFPKLELHKKKKALFEVTPISVKAMLFLEGDFLDHVNSSLA